MIARATGNLWLSGVGRPKAAPMPWGHHWICFMSPVTLDSFRRSIVPTRCRPHRASTPRCLVGIVERRIFSAGFSNFPCSSCRALYMSSSSAHGRRRRIPRKGFRSPAPTRSFVRLLLNLRNEPAAAGSCSGLFFGFVHYWFLTLLLE